MGAVKKIGKREFTLSTSKFLKEVERSGTPLIITDRGEPVIRLEAFKKRKIQDLAGAITTIEIKGDINDSFLPALDEWT